MRFHERTYKLHVILGNPASQPLWTRRGWMAIEPALLAVLSLIPGPKSMQSLQYAGSKQVLFGRVGMSKASLEKWVHDDGRYPDRNQWFFHSNELWAPGRTACEKLNRPPDLYFGFRNEHFYAPSTPSPCIVLAGALDRGNIFADSVDSFATALATATNALTHCSKHTPWGHSVYEAGFTEAIGDLLAGGVKTW